MLLPRNKKEHRSKMIKPWISNSKLKIKDWFDILNLAVTLPQIKYLVIYKELLNHGETILPDVYIRKKNEFGKKKNWKSEIFSKFSDKGSWMKSWEE